MGELWTRSGLERSDELPEKENWKLATFEAIESHMTHQMMRRLILATWSRLQSVACHAVKLF